MKLITSFVYTVVTVKRHDTPQNVHGTFLVELRRTGLKPDVDKKLETKDILFQVKIITLLVVNLQLLRCCTVLPINLKSSNKIMDLVNFYSQYRFLELV